MIARVEQGRTTIEGTDTYEQLLSTNVFIGVEKNSRVQRHQIIENKFRH